MKMYFKKFTNVVYGKQINCQILDFEFIVIFDQKRWGMLLWWNLFLKNFNSIKLFHLKEH